MTDASPALSQLQREEAVNAIWTEVLQKPVTAPTNDFFDAGGNSMLLIAMLGLIQERLNQTIEPAKLVDGISPGRLVELLA